MNGRIFLIIDGPNKHRLSDMPPADLNGYKQVSGPFAGMVPFFTVVAKEAVGGDRVAEIASSYIDREPQ